MKIGTFFKKLFSPLMVFNCLGVVVATLLLVGGALYFVDYYTNHGQTVLVPNVRGQKLEDVENKLEAIGLRCEVVDTGYIDTYVGDVVLEQGVMPGERVKPGRVIELTINSATARAIKLPVLANNSSVRSAEAKLRGLGFKSIRIEYIAGFEDWVYNVKVNGREATPGMQVPITTPITLVVGDGATDDDAIGDTIDIVDFLEENTYFDRDEILEDGGGEGYGDTEMMENGVDETFD